MADEPDNTGAVVEIHDGEETDLMPANIIDRVVFGRRLRALRVMNGYDRVTDFTAALRRKYGVDVSDRTVYAIERGEQMPHLDFFIATLACLKPEPNYFSAAIRHDVVAKIQELAK